MTKSSKNNNELALEKKLEKVRNQKPSLPTNAQLKVFVGDNQKTNRKEKIMKNINWKQILETTKTIIIVALIAGVAGVLIGINYQKSQHDTINNEVKEVVRSLKG